MSRARGRRHWSALRVLRIGVPLLALMTLRVDPARATSSSECIEANKKGQSLRRTGKFEDARAQFETCGDPKCPSLVAADCVSRQVELEQAQPTLVLQVSDSAGQDLTDVIVKLDDASLTRTIDGKELRVDPGRHVLTFQAPGMALLTRTVVIAEHEKGRRERVVLVAAKAAASDATPKAATVASSAGSESGATPHHPDTTTVLAFTAMGVGLAALAAGGVFGGLTFVEASAQKRDCGSATECPNYAAAVSDHNNAVFDGTFSNIALLSGAVVLAVGAGLLLTKPHHETSAWLVMPMIGPSTGIAATARF